MERLICVGGEMVNKTFDDVTDPKIGRKKTISDDPFHGRRAAPPGGLLHSNYVLNSLNCLVCRHIAKI